MRIRLSEPSLTDELIEFLRRCDCAVTPLGNGLLNVDLRLALSYQAAMELVQAGRCYGCGTEIEPVLRDLGSTLCHDCRDGENGNADGPVHANAALRARWARMEVDAYLKVWGAMHAGSVLELID